MIMRALSITLMLLSVAGCHRGPKLPGVNPEASARYRAAWEKRQAGDEAAFQAAMKELAQKYPDTRVGQRAKETLASSSRGGSGAGPMMGAAAAGVMAAVAVPAFLKYRARAAEQHKAEVSGPAGIRESRESRAPVRSKSASKRGWEPLK